MGFADLHEPASDLVDHAISAQGEHGVEFFGPAGELSSVARVLREDKREGVGLVGVKGAEALHTLGYAACGSRLGGGVGDDKRLSQRAAISKLHACDPFRASSVCTSMGQTER